MQTAKEFLDEEHQIILSTQTEANEYLLSCLGEFISRIREDFDQLNRTQLEQIENEYQQMINMAEENAKNNATKNEKLLNHQRSIQMECEKLQDEHQSTTEELTLLNEHNQALSERILSMVSLISIRFVLVNY